MRERERERERGRYPGFQISRPSEEKNRRAKVSGLVSGLVWFGLVWYGEKLS